MYVFLLSSATFTTAVLYHVLRRQKESTRDIVRSCLDPMSPEEAKALIEIVTSEKDTTDAIAAKLVKLYNTFLPSEKSLASMSLHTDALTKKGGPLSFATCTVYAAMTIALMSPETATRRRNIQRICSESARLIGASKYRRLSLPRRSDTME